MWAPTFSDTGGRLTLHTASLDGTMMTWDLSGSRRLGEPFQAGAGTDVRPVPIWDGPHVAVSPDGRLLAVNDIDGTSILDATTHAVVRTLKATQPDGSFDATWSPDGRRLAVTGTGTAIAELYDTATWQRVAPDGGPLAGPPADRPALAEEIDPTDPAETGRRLNGARAVAFSPDSTTLVAGTDDGAVWTWDARTGAPMGVPLRFGGFVLDLAFNPVSKALAVGYSDANAGGVAVFATGETTPQFTVSRGDAHGGAQAVAFSPDGTVLATGGDNGRRAVLGRDDRDGDRPSRCHGRGVGPRPGVDAVGQDPHQLRVGRDSPADRRPHEDCRGRSARRR